MTVSTFLYFAYGSNLLLKRIHINNPTASRVGTGKLKNYRLDFNHKSKLWGGAVATIVPDEGSHVWGALWQIHQDNLESLDKQEGVSEGLYKVVAATVELPSGATVECRSYQLTALPPKLADGEALPDERKPSKAYLDTILDGADESELPSEYIQQLKTIPHNGFCGPICHNSAHLYYSK